MQNKLRAQHYILFLAAFVGAVWFFIGYPSQDVRSVIDRPVTKSEIEAKAIQQLKALGYISDKYSVSNISLIGNDDLLDSLQHDLGRHKTIEILENEEHQNIISFYWLVTFTKKSQEPTSGHDGEDGFGMCSSGELCLQFDLEGRFRAFLNPSGFMPSKKINRSALGAVFAAPSDSLQSLLFSAVSDSLLNRLFYFDLQKPTESYADYKRKPAGPIKEGLLKGYPYRYSKNDARALASYYLKQTGWQVTSLERDSVFIERINSTDAANVRYKSAEPVLGQKLQLDLLVAPTGALLYLKADYNSNETQDSGAEFDFEIVWMVLLFLFALLVFIGLYLRMQARAVDTRPALVAAIVVGFVVVVDIFLSTLDQANLLLSQTTFTEFFVMLIGYGFLCGMVCISAFVLFAVGDSITRQYWTKKLHCYDYVRQGMIFNKPVGSVLLQSVALASILAGVWTLLLQLFPQVYYLVDTIFVSQKAVWPPLRLFARNAWASFFYITSVFLVVAGRVYGQWKTRWGSGLVMIIICALFIPMVTPLEPSWISLMVSGLFGLMLFLIYDKWDFLTLLLSYFLFLSLIGSTSGWIIPNSPDTFMFVFVVIMFVGITAAGIFAMSLGKEEQKLSSYIPEYVEEQAREERIKQELEIARKVQQSFLPKEKPNVHSLDIAAVCKPAYETGGDYYDFVRLDDHRIAVAIGDVSGKGIQSAFYMTYTKGLLHSLSRGNTSPAEVLKRANRFFYDNADKSTFISLIYGVIDLRKQTFTFARAGHNPVLHLNTSNGAVEELRPNGLGIGLTKEKIFDNKINEIKLSITDDDVFLLYTDGITEALNEEDQFYGSDRLINLVRGFNQQPASTIIEAINDEVTDFIGHAKQHDDMTIMAIRFAQISPD